MGLRRFTIVAALAALTGTTLVGTSAGATPGLAAGTPTVSRLAGADRVETAVRISQKAYTVSGNGSSGSVYLARMDVFADALAAGTLTDGPVLLVPTCGPVPKVVTDEVTRLSPARVVGLGGPGAICDQVLSDGAGGRQIARLAGVDRYLTSLEIAKERLRQGAATEIYVASGLDSPDAVVGGQLTRGPILLTGSVDRSTEYNAFLNEVKPSRVVALGGPGAVSDAQLSVLVGTKARLAGQSRFETAAAIAMRQFTENAETVYLARGDLYADGVASGALGNGPVLLVGQCSLPPAARERIASARPMYIVALGGPGAVCDDVLAQAAAATSATGGRTVAVTQDPSGWAIPGMIRSVVSSDGSDIAFSGQFDMLGSAPNIFRTSSWDTTMMPGVVNLDSADQRMEASLDWFDSSSDGRFVAFVHTPPATEAYPNPKKNVYVRDIARRTTVLASRTAANLPGNRDSYAPSISDDGLNVAFVSAATDLVPGDTNNANDVFRTGSFGGSMQLMSGANGRIGDAGSGAPALSADGTTVVFRSLASNLVSGDVDGTMDLIRVRAGYGEIDLHRVNTVAAPATSDPDRASSVSKDGNMVAYIWPGQAGVEALHVYDAHFDSSRPVASLGTQQAAPTSSFEISGDGKSVVVATAAQLGSEDSDSGQQDVSVCDTATAVCRLLSQEFTLRPTGVPSVIESVSTDFDASLVSYVASFPGLVSTDPAKGPTLFVWTKMPPS